MEYGVILTTTSSIEEAKKVAHYLVENKFAACANIVPKIISIYSWKEDICEDEEFLLLIKTKKSDFDRVKQAIIELHSYELPEIIMLPIIEGHKDYLDWIKESTTGIEKTNES